MSQYVKVIFLILPPNSTRPNIYTGGIKEHKDVNVDETTEEFHADMHSMSEYS